MMAVEAKPKRTAREHNRRMEIKGDSHARNRHQHHLDALRAGLGLSLFVDGQRRAENQ